MTFSIESKHLDGVVVLRSRRFPDDRGFFAEVFRADSFRELGLPDHFEQDNHSRSRRGVIRGLHFQWDPPMAKLMRVTMGRAFVVAVDIRHGSPTLGQWHGQEMSADEGLQLWAPAGFARGFLALSETVEIQYKCSSIYSPKGESGIRWNDPGIGIDWPVETPLLSEKDDRAQSLAEWLARPESRIFSYR